MQVKLLRPFEKQNAINAAERLLLYSRLVCSTPRAEIGFALELLKNRCSKRVCVGWVDFSLASSSFNSNYVFFSLSFSQAQKTESVDNKGE